MLKELKRYDWLSILGIPIDRIPIVFVLRGTRNLKTQYRSHRKYFTNILEIGTPNGILEDVFISDLGGHSVGYASVYGAPMASEVVHVFGILGTRLMIQTGCCGALADLIAAGDLFIATEAFCDEGASQYYLPSKRTVTASLNLRELVAEGENFHTGYIYTTSALFAEGMEEVDAWFRAGYSAVDMETTAIFAVAQYFGMDRASILYAFDNPRQKEHILLNDAANDEHRKIGNRRMIEIALETIKVYASRNAP